MNWLSMDIFREQSLKMYMKPEHHDKITEVVSFFFGNFGQVQGGVALIMWVCFIIPNCNNPSDDINMVKGDTIPKELLIFIAGANISFCFQLLTMLVTGKAEDLGFKPPMMWPWVVIQAVIALFAILASTDATMVTPAKSDGSENVLPSMLLIAIVSAASLAKVVIASLKKTEKAAAATAVATA